MSACDVMVIGAGPAGMAAATLTAKAGLSTLLVDENQRPGGQIYRATGATPVSAAVLGEEYGAGAGLVSELAASGAEVLSGATVWTLDRELSVGLSAGGASRFVTARRVIIATGAMERPFPIPGWTLPGVMTAGAAQTVLKASGLVPTGTVVFAGQGPLLWLLAAQILRAGGSIDCILDTTPARRYLEALPHALGFLLSPYALKGLRLMREVKAKVRVVRGVSSLRALGESRLTGVAYSTGAAEITLPADALFLHQGVVPHVNLAMAAGCAHDWSEAQACWTPRLDADGLSSVPGILIAGDGAGIGGGEAAAERGRLAGLAVVEALKPAALADLPARNVVAAALRRRLMGRAFLDRLFLPLRDFRVPADDATIVCRCEEVSAGDIRRLVAVGASGPNQLKAYSRCGMGPCQGRQCGLTVTEIIADARGVAPAEVGHYRLRPPVKPITLNEIADIPKDAEAVAAVVRG